NPDRKYLYERINLRVDKMLSDGLIAEAQKVIEFRKCYALKTVGYRELFQYFDNEISIDKAIELIKRNTRHFARRQITWFNKDREIKWYNTGDINNILPHIKKIINQE
ncbi:MAG: tRNA dimethylallyltransferase, partial [Bacteroidota bacterium]